MQKKLRIISRNSDLAMWQARHVQQQINLHYPDINIEIIGITTQGDRLLDRSLDKIGGKGLFIKELEVALLNNKADLAVHSLKDLPANLTPGFKLAAILQREEPADALVSNTYASIKTMPDGAIIGTSSIRRVAILNKYYPHLQVKLLRGNVITRLKKLDNFEYDAVILAVAGLKRLGLEQRICEYLPKDEFVPAIGQGALAIETSDSNNELNQLLAILNNLPSSIEVACERELGRIMQASCSVPIAAHAIISGDSLKLHAIILDKETGQFCSSIVTSHAEKYLFVANQCAEELIAQGALAILEKYS